MMLLGVIPMFFLGFGGFLEEIAKKRKTGKYGKFGLLLRSVGNPCRGVDLRKGVGSPCRSEAEVPN